MGILVQKFQIQRSLGKGGIGEAFLATETATGRVGALKKVPRTALAKKVESLRHEFVTMSQLAHPNIARVFEYGADADSVYFFGEYVEGADIFRSTQGADYNQILSCLAQILRALHSLHDQGYLHGDLKPENILVVRGVPLFRDDAVKLIDFGLAKHLGHIDPKQRPSGTIHFMAPEMLQGKSYDARADLFALGVCLYRMLAGHYPFEEQRGSLSALIDAQLKKIPTEPRAMRADLSKGLNDLVMKLMAKSPDDRFPDALSVLKALNAAEGEAFALWTPAELKISLHDGPFLGREGELAALRKAYQGGGRSFVVSGAEGAGKSRLIAEFRARLQLEGLDEATTFQERTEPAAGALKLPAWTAAELDEFLSDRLRLNPVPEAFSQKVFALSGGVVLKAISLLDFWLGDGTLRMEGDHLSIDSVRVDAAVDFDAVFSKKLEMLEALKKEVLYLCAFAGTPLGADLLRRILGEAGHDLTPVLEALEREGWLIRVLDHGAEAYRAEGLRRSELVERLRSGKSLEELTALVRQTYRAGDLRRARLHLEDLLARDAERVEASSRKLRGEIFEIAALVFLETGEWERAEEFSKKLLALPELTDTEHAKGLNRLGWVCYRRGHYEDARRIFEKAEPLWEKTGDVLGRAAALNFLAMTCQALKHFDAAMERYRGALSFLPEGEEWRAMIHMNLGLCAQEAQKYADAIDAYEAALGESENVKDARIRTAVLNNLSNLYVYLGRLDRAGGLGHASLKFAIENGLTGLEGQNYLFLAHVADKEGNLEDFRKYVAKAKSVLETAGSVSERARARLYEAYLDLTAGEDKACREVLKGLRADFPAEAELMAQCDLVEGKLALKKDPPDAVHGAPALERAKAYYESRSDEANLWEVLNALGQIHRVDQPGEARASLTKALAMLDRLSEKIPEAYRAGFFRDRKREKILENLNRLNAKEAKRGDHGENRPN